MAGPPALRRIAGDVNEIAFCMAFRTHLRCSYRGDGVATIVALPVGQAAVWTNIPDEFTRRCVAAQGALHFSFFLFHLISLLCLAPVPIGCTLLCPAESYLSTQPDLFSPHNLPTLGAFLLEAGTSQLVRLSFTTIRADAVSTRASFKTTSPTATTTTSPPASPFSRPLPLWPCSISSDHFHRLLFRNRSFCCYQSPTFVAWGGAAV